MPSIYKKLRELHTPLHTLTKKKKYSNITLFDWGGDLSKKWYVYYHYRNPETDKLTRQTNIHGNINQFSTIRDRKKAAKIIMEALEDLLESGSYNPYDTSSDNIATKSVSLIQTAKQAISFALDQGERMYSASTYSDFKSRIKKFEKFLEDKGLENYNIKKIGPDTAIDFLNEVLSKSSPRNRNNTRLVLSSFYKILKNNQIVRENIIEGLNVLKSNPEKNKSFTADQEDKLLNLIASKDKNLLLYVKFISINMLRPIEVSRLQVRDIHKADGVLKVKAKNQPVKTKIIPKLLLDDIPDLASYNPTDYLFTPTGIGHWEATEVNRRTYFGKRFKAIKDELGLGKEYGLYSFRHTYITKLYRELRKDLTPFETKSRLMLITGHLTMDALEKYLRDIDAELPEDYSDLLMSKNGK